MQALVNHLMDVASAMRRRCWRERMVEMWKGDEGEGEGDELGRSMVWGMRGICPAMVKVWEEESEEGSELA